MPRKVAPIVTVLALAVLLGISSNASTDNPAATSGLTVHEWGTFTSVAGPDGQTAQWLPLSGSSDLPCFVNSFRNRLFKDIGLQYAAIQKNSMDYAKARTQLLGPVRMETPVLYFYSPKPEKVGVRVAFPKGFVTEWYPQANVNQTPVRTGVLDKSQDTGASIVWKNVEVLSQDTAAPFLKGSSASHYYAARATDANPIRVGKENEKFLFYRGVGGFPIPINVTVTDTGKILVKHLTGKLSVILFESRGGKLGY